MLTFHWALRFKEQSGLSDLTVPAFTPFIKLSGTEHALLIFGICMSVLFLPKILALLDLAFDQQRKRAFGGLRRATLSAVAETFFSSLHAPLQMLWHSKFVVTILFGVGVHWGPQKRTANGLPWSEALRTHWSHTLIGVVWGYLIWRMDHPAFWWFLPVLAGMLFSVPLSVFTSRPSLGSRTRGLGLFLTPEETFPPSELDTLRMRMAVLEKSAIAPPVEDFSIAQAVLDPYVNAIHVSLLREKGMNPEYSAALKKLGVGEARVRELGEHLLKKGPETLSASEKLLVLSDAEVMPWLHRQAWIRPTETLASWWQTAIRQYVR
jgi:membrane glycosyltransferase